MFSKSKCIALLVGIAFVITACGGDDYPINLKDASIDEGTCRSFVLRVEYEGIEGGGSHMVQMRETGTDTVVDEKIWAHGGTLFWRDLSCDADSPTWVEEDQACRFDVVVVLDEEESKRETVEIECD